MKKIIVVILILLFSLSVFISYDKHFKYYLGKEYKNEITLLLENEIPKSMKEVDGLFKKIENEKDVYDKQLMIEMGCDEIVFDLFMKIKMVTQKYVNIEKSLEPNDDVGQLIITLKPYLSKNKIDTTNLDKFLINTDKESLRIKKLFGEFCYLN